MALTKEQLTARIETALAEVSQHVGASDWQSQDAAINGVMDASTAVYLRLNLETGEFASVEQMVKPNLAQFEFAMRALINFWAAMIDDIASKAGAMPEAEQTDLQNMYLRLAKYRSALDAAKDEKGPSEIVWTRVGMPMLMGVYPLDFKSAGIANPGVQSNPDIYRPFTLSTQWAIGEEHKKEAWQQLASDLAANAGNVVSWILDAPGKVIGGIKDAAKSVGRSGRTWALALGLGIAGLAGIAIATRK